MLVGSWVFGYLLATSPTAHDLSCLTRIWEDRLTEVSVKVLLEHVLNIKLPLVEVVFFWPHFSLHADRMASLKKYILSALYSIWPNVPLFLKFSGWFAFFVVDQSLSFTIFPCQFLHLSSSCFTLPFVAAFYSVISSSPTYLCVLASMLQFICLFACVLGLGFGFLCF